MSAWYIQQESDGYHIVRNLVQHGPGAFEYWPSPQRPFHARTLLDAQHQLNIINADLAREDNDS